MKTMFPFAAAALSAVAALATPPKVLGVLQTVDDHRDVIISYVIDQDAIVTVEICTNGVPVGPEKLTTLSGDINAAFRAGSHTIKWEPRREGFAEPILPNSTATVTAWALDAPPPVMAVSMATPSNVTFYADIDYLPGGGLTNNIYKKEWMVFRKIPAAGVTWRMGTPAVELDSTKTNQIANECAHLVSFSEDFYAAVYECTRAQWKIYANDYGWDFSYDTTWTPGDGDTEFMPITRAAWQWVAGQMNWPIVRTPAAYSILSWMRRRSGDTVEFNLPTDAQWEYAARAGTTTALPDGTARRSATAPYWTPDRKDANGVSRLHVVGELAPNGFGLYDVIGNVCEMCLDVWSQPLKEDELDPVGPSDGNASFNADTRIVHRGGSFDGNNQWIWDANSSFMHRSAARAYDTRKAENTVMGFRLFAPARYRFRAE